MFNLFKRFKNKKLPPKIVIRHRERVKGAWFRCECVKCEYCKEMSRWEDRHCINCFLKKHDLVV